MKKLLLSALALVGLAGFGQAFAYDQVVLAPPVTSLTDGGYYYIYDAHGDNGTADDQVSNNNCRYAFRKAMAATAGANVQGVHKKPIQVFNSPSLLDNFCVWQAHATESGAWQFQNVGNSYYIAGTSGNVSVNEAANATSFVLEAVSGQAGTFKVKVEGTNNTRWDGNGGESPQMVYYGGDGHPIRFYDAVAEGDGYKISGTGAWNVTYTYPAYNGKVITKTVLINDGEHAQYHVPAVEFFTPSQLSTPNGTVISGTNKEFTISAGSWNFPALQSNHVYRAKMRPGAGDRKSLWFNGEHPVSSYTDEQMLENSADMDLYWYFKVGNMNDEGRIPVTIHGVGMADNEGIEVGASNNSLGVKSETPTVWYLAQSTAPSAGHLDIVLQHSGITGDGGFMNDVNYTLGVWAVAAGRNDGGSVMRLTDLADSDWTKMAENSEATEQEITDAKANPTPAAIRAIFAKMEVDAALVEPYKAAAEYFINLGFGNEADKAAWQAAKDALGTKIRPADYKAFQQAFETLLDNAASHVPAEGKHVKFLHYQRPVYMGLVNGNIQRGGNNDGTTTFTLYPAEGGFKIFNEYAAKYIQHPAGDNTNVSLVSNVADASVYKLDFESLTLPAGSTDYNFGIKNTAGGDHPYLHSNNANNDQTNVVRWNPGTSSSWYIKPSDANTAANEYLAGAKAYFDGQTFGTGIGEYGITPDSQAAADAAKQVGSDASIDEKRAAGNTLRNPQTALNMPQVGHVYMFSKADMSMYMSNDTVSDHRATMLAPTEDNLISRLFYLDADNHLLSLKSGKVMGRFASNHAHGNNIIDHSWRTVLLSNTDKVGTFTFGEAAERGKYTIAAQGSRYLYNGATNVDCGTDANNVNYYWTIEDKGEWIPVAGSDVDHTTLCLPFAVQLRDGMTVHTAKVTDGKVILVEFEGNVIPANTPVLVDFSGVQRGDNGLVYLDRYYGETTPVEGNELQGSPYAFEVSTPVALRSGETTFLPASGIVLGCRAYVPGGLHTLTTQAIEDELSGLVGKVFTLRNSDVANNRGFLLYREGETAIWTNNKRNATGNLGADAAVAASATDINYHWTLVEHDGKRYLYNLGARKFAGCYAAKGGNGGDAEFVWEFSDYPTAIDFHFYDYEIAETVAGATFNIIGGENVGNARPAGMMIINGNTTHPVPGVSGNSANDGCGFWITVLENATPGEVASVEAAHTAMEAEHAAAVEYAKDETNTEVPGHYNAEGHAAFAAVLTGEPADAQSKYYAVVRARQAAGNRINTFAHNGAYNLFDSNGDKLVAKIAWNEARYTLSVGIADETTGEYDGDWLCEVQDDGTLLFTHGFGVDEKAREENARAAVRARVESANEEGIKVATVKLQEPAAATYDGMGNIMVGDLAVKSSAALEDAHTTGISELTADAQATGAAYDLMGRRVNASAKGIVIINGKKTLRL